MKKSMFLFISFVSICHFGITQNLDVIKVPDPMNPGESISCGKEGSAKNGRARNSQLAWIGNPQKNRWDIPSSPQIKVIKIEDLISLRADKKKFRAGSPVRVTAYVYDVKPGGAESCNCGTKATAFKDTHIELTPDDQNTSEEFRFVIEVTPRLRMLMHKQGVDWSTSNLKSEILGHMVTVEGWLFYDEIHEPQAFSTNPDNSNGKNWRASPWEIHPVTSIEVIDAVENDNIAMDDGDFNPITPTSGPVNTSAKVSQVQATSDNDPTKILSIILLGALLGIVGQMIRVLVGLKKLKDASETKSDFDDKFDLKKLILSLVYASIIGLAAGTLMAVDNLDKVWDRSTILAIVAAGYAGVDFIEGFLSNNLPSAPVSAAPKPIKIATPPKEGPIEQ
jgi:hypothetical protein